jgi:hypothetical protein
MNKLLTELDYKDAANLLGVNVAAIKAVAEVEAAGSGFLPDGRPKILFEAHIFSKFTNRVYNASHPDISSTSWNRSLYKGGTKEYERLEKAKKLNLEAAYKATSWGKFQIMGFNYLQCGYNNVFEFVEDMFNSEREHLIAFCKFINRKIMHQALKGLNWAKFAFHYNGAGYKKNQYDIKLAKAYKKFLIESSNNLNK